MKNKISYFNCTAIQAHIGCYAVTDAHFRMLISHGYKFIHISPLNALNEFKANSRYETSKKIKNSYLMDIINKSDAIIINGEGTIHHGGGLTLLSLAEVAIECKKPVFLVNAVMEKVEGYDDVLKNLSDLNVRESRSSSFLKKKNISHRVVLDSILAAKFNQASYLDLKNKIIITDWHKQRDSDVGVQLTLYERTHRADVIYLPIHHLHHIQNNNWRGIIASLSQAKLIITGRHHAIYLAALAKIPIVALPSNTYKVEGFLEMLPIKISFCHPKDNLYEKIEYALDNLNLTEDLYKYIKGKPLTTFDKLYSICPASTSKSKEEIESIVTILLENFINITIRKEIQNSYLPLQTRVQQVKKIQYLETKEKTITTKLKILENRILLLGESRKKLIQNYQILKERYIALQESRKVIISNNGILKNKIMTLQTYKKSLLAKYMTLKNKSDSQVEKKNSLDEVVTNDFNYFIDKFMYKEWLDKYQSIDIDKINDDFKLKLAMSLHGTLAYDKAIIAWNDIIDIFPDISKKNLARIYIEQNYLKDNLTIFNKWNESFALLLARKDHQKAWHFFLQRSQTLKLFSEKKHLLVQDILNDTILILPDGGIGDELRNSIIYTRLVEIYPMLVIACDKRLLAIFQTNMPQIHFIANNPNLKNHFNIVSYVYDLFHKISPFENNKQFLTPNIDLVQYWRNYLKKLSKGRRIVGICQGTHIWSFDRISNIFPFSLWKEYLSQEILFINLSLDYTGEIKNILNMPIDYHDDFDNLGAIISCCDYVITPANTILDYCGSLGVPCIGIYVGYKFSWRINKEGLDKIHLNTRWIGQPLLTDKEATLKLAFSYLSTKLVNSTS